MSVGLGRGGGGQHAGRGSNPRPLEQITVALPTVAEPEVCHFIISQRVCFSFFVSKYW